MFTADVWYRCLVMFFGGVLLGWTPNLRQEVHDLGQKLKASQDAWPGHAVPSRFVLLKQSQDLPRYWFMSSGIGEFKHIQTRFFFVFLVNYLCSSAGSMADEIHSHPDVMYPMYLNQGQKIVPFNKDISTKDSFLALSSCFSRFFLAHEVQSA